MPLSPHGRESASYVLQFELPRPSHRPVLVLRERSGPQASAVFRRTGMSSACSAPYVLYVRSSCSAVASIMSRQNYSLEWYARRRFA